jgi:hypothetical protein
VTAQRKAVIVVAGQDVERRLERRQQLVNQLVLGIEGMFGQITGEQHRVGVRLDFLHRLDRSGEPRDGIAVTPVRTDVGVAELDEHERSLHASRC